MTTDAQAAAVGQLPWIVVKVGALVTAALSSQWVVFILVPVLVTLGAMYLKAFARPTYALQPENKVVGFDLGITACVTLIISGFVLINRHSSGADATAIDRQYYLIGLFIVFGLFVVALVFGAYAMHKHGWDATDSSRTRAPWPTCINIGGAVLLVIAFVLTGGAFK